MASGITSSMMAIWHQASGLTAGGVMLMDLAHTKALVHGSQIQQAGGMEIPLAGMQ